MANEDRQNRAGARMAKRSIAAHYRAMGQSQEQAAQAAGCTRQSISLWELGNDAAYRRAFDEARARLLREGWGEAWHTLRDALRSETESIRVQAAGKIVDAVAKDYPSRQEITGAEGGPIEERQIVIGRPTPAEEPDA